MANGIHYRQCTVFTAEQEFKESIVAPQHLNSRQGFVAVSTCCQMQKRASFWRFTGTNMRKHPLRIQNPLD